MKDLPYVSIAIITYNAEETIEKCISSVFQVDYPREKYEVIVVDGGSTDRTLEILRKYPVDKVIISKRRGLGYARNLCINEARYEIVAMLDADEVPPEDWIKRFIRHFNDSKVGVIFGGVKVPFKVTKPSSISTILYFYGHPPSNYLVEGNGKPDL